MPGEGTQFAGVVHGDVVSTPYGLPVWQEASGIPAGLGTPMASRPWGSTGRSATLPDLVFNATAPQVLVPALDCPNRPPMRLHVTDLRATVLGSVPWLAAGVGDGVYIEDTNGNPIAYFPCNSLRGEAKICFPTSEAPAPQYLGAGQAITFVSLAAGVLTFSGNFTITTTQQHYPLKISQGTGQGQTAKIISNTATTITVAASAFPTAPDNTSVFEVPFYVATAGGAATLTLAGAAFGVNGLDNGYSSVIVAGTSLGSVRPVASNTATILTSPYNYNTNPAVGGIARVTNRPDLNGAVDLGIGGKGIALSLGAGLRAAVQGAPSQGSPLRFYWEAFWAA